MAKTSKGMILNSQNKLQSDLQFVLIDIDDKDSMSLIRSVDQNLIFIDAVSKRTNWIRSNLDQLGLKAGCYLISDLRDQTNVDIVSLINAFSPIRQYGYQVGIIADINQLPSLDELIKNQVYLINSGKSNQKQDALLQNNEIDDCSGKLSKGMSVAWQRDYTNVDISIDRAGYVGMGQDTLLKGGKGFGYSTNGKDFNTVISPKGIIFRRADAERMWRLLRPKEINDIDMTVNDRVKKMVDSATAEIPQAVSNANEAVKKADSAIASSKVNSDAIVAQSEAISEAKAAMERATAEIQQTASNAASDAAKIRADVAQVQNEVDTAKAANSASVEALKSDVSAAKQDLADVHDSLTKAQAAAEQNQKAINDSIAEINANVDATNQDLAGVRKDLTKAQSDITANQKAVNDNVAQINSDIEQDRKDIASAQQANADTVKQLDAYSKQAQEQGKTIKAVQDKQDGFYATLADVQGNVSQVSDKVSGLSASLKDAQDNVASVKAQADQLSATLTDHSKSIAILTASAKELSSTLKDADGRLSKVEQTAQTNSSTLSDVQGDLSQVKQNATKLVSTLKDAQGNISTLQQKADSLSTQLASAQGDISTLRKTATDVTSELEDHTGRLSKVEQSAAKQATTLSDLQGNLSQVEQKADSNTATISSINKNAMQDRGVITDTKTSFDSLTQLGTYSIKASGLPKMPEQHYGTLVVSGSAGSGWLSQQFVADTTGNVYTRVFSNNDWSAWKQGGSQDAINQVKQTADSNSATIRNVQGDVSTLKQTATGIKSTLASHEGDIHTLQADSKSLKDSMTNAQGDISMLKKTSTDVVSELKDHAGRISKTEQTASTLVNEFADQQGHLNRVEQTAQGTQQTVANQQGQINTIKTDASGIHETLTGQGNQIANINVTLSGLNSKYDGVSGDLSKLSDKVTTNSTQIDQDKKLIALKADQTTVDNLSGEVSQNKAQLTVQAGQISSKVSGIETSLADANSKINDITSNGGGRNLLKGTQEFQGEWINSSFWKVSEETYRGLTVRSFSASWWGFGQYYDADPNTTYTFSFYAKASEAGNIMDIFTLDKEDWSSPVVSPPVFANRTVTTEWQRYSVTFTTKSGGKIMPSVCLTKNNITIYVAGYMLEEGIVAHTWSPSPEDTDAKIMTNSTAIDQTNKQISLKADQTEVDKIKNTATQNSSRLDMMAGQISSKVTSTDVNNIVNGKGYATTSTVQSLVDQKAGTINESITNLDAKYNATVTQVQSLTASIDGLQSIVQNKADKSQITQLSNVIQSKVSSSDFNALKDETTWKSADSIDLNTAVFQQKIFVKGGSNLPPGGYWWYVQVEPGYNSRIVQYAVSDRDNIHYSRQYDGKQWTAWSQGATESEITQLRDDINLRVKSGDLLSQLNLEAGRTLIQSNKIFLDADSVVFSKNSKAFIPSAAIENLEADKITTGTLNGVEIRQLETGGRSIDIKNGNIAITSHDPYEPRISFTNDGKNMKMFNALGDLEVINQDFSLFNFTPDDTSSINPIPFFRVVNTGNTGSGSAHLYMDHAIIDGNEWWTPAGGITFGRTWDGTNTSSDYVDLYAKSFVPHSELSAKTRIKKLDRKEALDKIMQDDMYTYQFKEDVRDGVSKRYASFIIDNIHDVAQYTEPEEFLSANGKGRDDGTQLAYLIAAVQYQQEQIEELKKKLEEK